MEGGNPLPPCPTGFLDGVKMDEMPQNRRPPFFLTLLLASACLVAGCGKKQPPTPPEPGPVPAVAPATPAKPEPAPAIPTPTVKKKPKPAPALPAADDFEAGLREVLDLEQDARFSDALRHCRGLITKFRGHPDAGQLDEIEFRLKEERREALDLPFAVKNLGSGNNVDIQVAKEKLLAADDTGLIFLRRAVRKEPDAVAAQAANILGELRDGSAPPSLVGRMKKAKPDSALLAALGGAAALMPGDIGPEDRAECLRLIREDEGKGWREAGRPLVAILDGVCGRDAGKFNDLMEDPDAFVILRACVEKALASPDPAAAAWACEHGGSLRSFLNGLRGRYYTDRDFRRLAFVRQDQRLYFADAKSFRFDPPRIYNFSVRWDGFLDVEKPGDCSFFLMAETSAEVYVDDKTVAHTNRWYEWTGKARLEAGHHPFRTDLLQTAGNGRIDLRWSAPGVRKTTALPFRCRPWPAAIADLPSSIDSLVSTNRAEVRKAKTRLELAGSVGGVFLREALRTKPDNIAERAADLLVQRHDLRTADLLLDRIERAPDSPLAPELVRALRILADGTEPTRYALLYRAVKEDAGFGMVPEAAALCGILESVCGGDAEKFNKLMDDPGAYAALQAYVEMSAASKDPSVVAAACEFGAPIVPYLRGIHGRYYFGHYWDERAFDRLDSRMYWANNQMPFPDKRQDDISFRWRGLLDIEEGGEYAFLAQGYGWTSLEIDRKNIAVQSGYYGFSNTVNLAKGLHPIDVDWRDNSSYASVEVYWQKRGNSKREYIPGRAVVTRIWDTELNRLQMAVPGLDSDKLEVVSGARGRFAFLDPVGRYYLRNAVRYDSGRVVEEAARLLVELDDENTPAVLLDRIEKEKDPDSPVLWTIAKGLQMLAHRITTEDARRMYAAVKADRAPGMSAYASGLCGVLVSACHGDAMKFGGLVDDPQGYNVLRRHVEAALVSRDDNAVIRACRFGVPFAPLRKGFRGRYYAGTFFDQLMEQRYDRNVLLSNRSFGLKTNRVERVSAKWTGIINVETPAKYTITGNADDFFEVRIDGERVASNNNTSRGNLYLEGSGDVTLEKGPHAVAVDFAQYHSGYNSRIDVKWTGPAMDKHQFAAGAAGTPSWKHELQALSAAVAGLAAKDTAELETARATLLVAEDVGKVFLRNAARYSKGKIFEEATRMLADYVDDEAAAILVERLRTDAEKAGIVPVITERLSLLARKVEAEELAWLMSETKKDKSGRMVPQASVLCAVLRRACGGDAARFNKLMKDARAHERLRGYVETALKSKDLATVVRACRYGAPFVPMTRMIDGQYYEGRVRSRLVHRACDASLVVANHKFPIPGERQERISAQWRGFLNVEKPGDYVFYASGDDYAAVWIDDEPVVVSSGGSTKEAKLNLDKGLHSFRVDYSQSTGNAYVTISLAGPDISKQTISGKYVSTVLWTEYLHELAAAVDQLGSKDEAVARAARAKLFAAGDVSRAFLRNAVRDKPAAIAVPAAEILVREEDGPTADILAGRMKREKSKSMDDIFADGLSALARDLDPSHARSFNEWLKTGAKSAMDPRAAALSGVLVRRCGNAAKAYNSLLKDPEGYERLESYFDAALISKNAAEVGWACEYGGSLVPTLPALRGRYYHGVHFDKLVHNRFDGNAHVGDRQFAFPDKRQDDIAVRWTGSIDIKTPGDYTFYVQPRDDGRILVDGKVVAGGWGDENGAETAGQPVKLAKGPHTFSSECRSLSGSTYIYNSWSGPGITKKYIPVGSFRTHAWQEYVAVFPDVVAKLASENTTEQNNAKTAIKAAQGIGLVCLRNAVRHAADDVAAAAALMLAELEDKHARPLIVERLKRSRLTPARKGLIDSLKPAAVELGPEIYADLVQLIKEDAKLGLTQIVPIFDAVIEKRCGKDARKLDSSVNVPKARETIDAYVGRALDSGKGDVFAWATAYKGWFGTYTNGVTARFFEGPKFGKPAAERVDAYINVGAGGFPVPAATQTNMSARWTALLAVEKEGAYVFDFAGGTSQGLWIDGKPVAKGATLQLQPRAYEFKAECVHAGKNDGFWVHWSGPGIGKQLIPGKAFRTKRR